MSELTIPNGFRPYFPRFYDLLTTTVRHVAAGKDFYLWSRDHWTEPGPCSHEHAKRILREQFLRFKDVCGVEAIPEADLDWYIRKYLRDGMTSPQLAEACKPFLLAASKVGRFNSNHVDYLQRDEVVRGAISPSAFVALVRRHMDASQTEKQMWEGQGKVSSHLNDLEFKLRDKIAARKKKAEGDEVAAKKRKADDEAAAKKRKAEEEEARKKAASEKKAREKSERREADARNAAARAQRSRLDAKQEQMRVALAKRGWKSLPRHAMCFSPACRDRQSVYPDFCVRKCPWCRDMAAQREVTAESLLDYESYLGGFVPKPFDMGMLENWGISRGIKDLDELEIGDTDWTVDYDVAHVESLVEDCSYDEAANWCLKSMLSASDPTEHHLDKRGPAARPVLRKLVFEKYEIPPELDIPNPFRDRFLPAALHGKPREDKLYDALILAYLLGATWETLPPTHIHLVGFFRHVAEQQAEVIAGYPRAKPKPPAPQRPDLSANAKEIESLLASGLDPDELARELILRFGGGKAQQPTVDINPD